MGFEDVIGRLRSQADPANVAGMERFGIRSGGMLGVSMPYLRKLAKELGKDHELALRLWGTDIHEARILASLVDEPGRVSEEQMEEWVSGFDSWGVCDQVCGNLFDKTPFALEKAVEWSGRDGEYVRRAGFVLMATLAVHDRKASDEVFERFLPHIVRGSADGRNFVRKAVNWALRQIGKRNKALNKKAVRAAKKIKKSDSKAARWVAADALRELTGEAVCKRLR